MLPQHRAPPASESLSRLTKSSNPFSKFITRWIILVCIVLAVLWFGGPLVGGIIGAPPPEFDYYGGSPRPINNGPPPPTFEDQEIWDSRKLEVREAFKHAWTGYNTRAFPSDELLAVSGGKSDKYVVALPFPFDAPHGFYLRYNGWSVTLFDSLDTMWIMGLRDEFHDAVKSIKGSHFNATKVRSSASIYFFQAINSEAQPNHYAPFFETTIRYLGGCLSAYALSGEQTLLDLADELGQLLIPAFTGTESGLPAYSVNVETYDFTLWFLFCPPDLPTSYDPRSSSGKILADGGKSTVLFAEATTCQLEFKYLAKLTGKKEYYERVSSSTSFSPATSFIFFYSGSNRDECFLQGECGRWVVQR
jgi:mannosyl-oligosaccharide alpha-1,2-mannosidase